MRISLLLVAIVLAGACVGCSKPPDPIPPPQAVVAPPPVAPDLTPIADYLQHLRFVQVMGNIEAERYALRLRRIELGGPAPTAKEVAEAEAERQKMRDEGGELFRRAHSEVERLTELAGTVSALREIEHQLLDGAAVTRPQAWRNDQRDQVMKLEGKLRTQLDLAGFALPEPTE